MTSTAAESDRPDLSICIVSWNAREYLVQALRSIRGAGCAASIEVIVIDNASRDGSPEMVAEQFPWVRLIANPDNAGFARANNQGITASRGRYVLLLNPDTIVHPCACDGLVAAMEARPEAAAVGPLVRNRDGSVQYSARTFPTLRAALFRLFTWHRAVRRYLLADWDHRSAREVDWASGAAICLRREAIEKVGALDEQFYMYCEDMDWCYRARQAGWSIWHDPAATIIHFRGASSDQCAARMVLAFHRSMRQFYWKHYAPGVPWPVRWIPVVGIWLRTAAVLAQVAIGAVGRWLRRAQNNSA